MTKFTGLIAAVSLAVLAGTAYAAPGDYIVDDGTAEASIGGNPADTLFLWANQFETADATDEIVAIYVAFGDPLTFDASVNSPFGAEDGSEVTVYLWDDPNNDGSPDDAVEVWRDTGTIVDSDTDTFVRFSTGAPLVVSGSFFVGVTFENAESFRLFPAGLDESPPNAGVGWSAFETDISGAEPTAIFSNGDYDGNWMVRAAGDEDNDGFDDIADNCPTISNQDQTDTNGDGFGDACVFVFIDPSIDLGLNPFIAEGVDIGRWSRFGDNLVLERFVFIGSRAVFGDDVFVGSETVVRRKAVVGDNVVMGSNTRIARNVEIGNNVTIGDDVVIKKNVRICSDAVIGSGATVRKNRLVGSAQDVPDGANWKGLPKGRGCGEDESIDSDSDSDSDSEDEDSESEDDDDD